MKLYSMILSVSVLFISTIFFVEVYAIDSPFGYRDGSNGTINVVNGKKELVVKEGTTVIYDREYDFEGLTSVVIPNSVVSIGDNAFAHNELTEVIIPNSVTEIEDDAFSHNKLHSVKIGSGVTKIGASAFADNKLTEIIISDSVVDIGTWAFSRNNLVKVMLTKKLYNAIKQKYFLSSYFGSDVKYELFDKTPVYIPKSRGRLAVSGDGKQQQRALIIKDGVASIKDKEFVDQGITSLVISNSVTSIGVSAFANNKITSVVIPDSVVSIGIGAFNGNPLTTVTLSKALYDAIPSKKLDDIFGDSVTTYWKQ